MSILSWFKKYFIPHEEDSHKPHFLRWKTTVVILGFILFVEILFLVQTLLISPRVNFFAEILGSVIVQETNADRVASDLQPLALNDELSQAAQMKANDMATKSYFAHTSPQGVTPWYWFDSAGYKYLYAGENLAINFSDSKDVVDAWMNSFTHRANIINAKYTETGIGTAQGVYQGKETTFIVQLFGRPQTVSTVTVAKKVTAQAQKASLKLSENILASESFKTATSVVVNFQPAQTNVYGAETSTQVEPAVIAEKTSSEPSGFASKLLAMIIASPHSMLNYLCIVLATIVLLALALTIGIKYKIQYPHLIANGLLILMVIGSVMIVNQYLIFVRGQIF